MAHETKSRGSPTSDPWTDSPDYPLNSIAIVGMAGRFPEADSIEEFWDLILEGRSTVRPAPVERLKLPQSGDYANTTWWGNFIRDPDAFDHRFFKKSSREAIAWDPQQRVLIEVMYNALESAGHFGPTSDTETKDYGCYIGAVMNNYYDNLSCHTTSAYSTIGTSRPFLSGAMSHYFGFTGPALTIDTACSSSLVAINTACRAIWSGECTRAVAGGTNIISSPQDYQNLNAAGFLSPTGQCKPFDIDADGYCRGEAVAVVVLKRLSDAIKDNNNILGVILGSAVNQNYNFSHITVPHPGSQAELYQKAMQLGNVTPELVSYVETHGTGTGVGDPVEVQSVRDAIGGSERKSLLHFGSVKGNIGHTEASAGVSGLVKVLLMMEHGIIPKQASYKTLNPRIPSLVQDNMRIPTSNIPWMSPMRLAFVNSHGAAGSNSTLLVREAPFRNNTEASVQLSEYPLVITAGSVRSLSKYGEKLSSWIDKAKKTSSDGSLLASLAFNLADRANHSLPYVFTTSVSSIQHLETGLEAVVRGSGIETREDPKSIVLVFGGQESDFIGLSRNIYHSSKIFRKHLDGCNEVLVSKGLESLYPAIFSTEPIESLSTFHAALFAVQYASAKAWIDCGLKVDAVVGHSFGQLTAYCIAGSLTLIDALSLVVERASLMQKFWGPEKGAMLSLQADQKTVEEILCLVKAKDPAFHAEIACYNSPMNHVVVGSASTIDRLEQFIANAPHLQRSIRSKRLSVTHGFHSKFTEPLLPHLDALAKRLDWKHPKIHIEVCDNSSDLIEPDFKIVSQHTRQPVFFQQAIERLATRHSKITWLEAGRGSSVLRLVEKSVPDMQDHTFLSPQLTSSKALESLVGASTKLWKSGYAVQFWPFHRSERQAYPHLGLPPYQFEKTRHWLPFIPREAHHEVKKEENEAHELITFLRFNDTHEKQATFQIDPKSERFQAMLGGHVMAGQKLAPASLYLELITRAALFLAKDLEAKEYVPVIEDLRMKSPIGSSASVEILLHLRRLNITDLSWSFSFTTKDDLPQNATSREHCTGNVYLKKRDDLQAAREIERFESLTGYRKYRDIIDHQGSESMQGSHIYRAFSTVVDYGEIFHGIKKVACLQSEAAGTVTITLDTTAPTDQRICDTPMTDSFMQFSGFLVNYFNNPNLDNVFVCGEIDQIKMGGRFNPDAKEWIVYSNMISTGTSNVSSDVYVFEADTRRMVMAVLGIRFTKMSKALLGNILKGVNQDKISETMSQNSLSVESENSDSPAQKVSSNSIRAPSSGRDELVQILSSITDFPPEKIHPTSTLDDLGIDSLMATEVLNDVRKTLGLTIDLTTFLFFPNIQALIAHIDQRLGINSDDEELTPPSTNPEIANSEVSHDFRDAPLKMPMEVQRPDIISAITAFEKTRLDFDQLAEETKAVGFWSGAYPNQARLVLAYVVEAFAELGCDLNGIQPGGHIPYIKALDKHAQLVRQLYRVVEDGGYIVSSNDGFTRSGTPVDTTPSDVVFQQIIGLHPQHDNVNMLIKAVGSRMAECLSGAEDGLQVVFGDKQTKELLKTMYASWPLLKTATMILGNFLLNAFANSTGSGKFRILEVGAGTGGTTRYIVDLLQRHNIDFEYVFTDISTSLVATAKKQFGNVNSMLFDVVDIEKPVRAEYEGAFHCIIATNCVHATEDLEVSLSHLHKMLRKDGALTLIEITKNMFWLDIVVGLFEGWWAFNDGRTHAIVDEKHWERVMKSSGFSNVRWSDGSTPESETVRVIAAFPVGAYKSSLPDVETVVYKSLKQQDIHADIYYPPKADYIDRKLPIALMIHGGSHVMFSRKDVRPAQTRLLLSQGFLPVSIDHRLCPEISLAEGPMVDVRDALHWVRNTLPNLDHRRPGLHIDGSRVVVVGWSSGGQLAMSLAWTSPEPPNAILAFYCPTNYADEWWRHPIQPIGAEDKGYEYDILEAIQDEPITSYGTVGAWEPLSDPRIFTDPRCRIALHINWKAQTLPVILDGLPSRRKAGVLFPHIRDWNKLPQPSDEKIEAASALAQIQKGNYATPTFLVHGTADDLVPWQQSQVAYEALKSRNVDAQLVLVEGAPHICDLSTDPESEGWKAVVKGYEFLVRYIREEKMG